MMKSLKNISKIVCTFAVLATLGACGGGENSKDNRHYKTEYARTHQNDAVTKVHAKIIQKSNKRDLGDIQFKEVDSGLSMHVNLEHMRNNGKYWISLYDIKDCEKVTKDDKVVVKCEKEKLDVDMPTLNATSTGIIKEDFIIKGITAKTLKNTKMVLKRNDDNGKEVAIAAGHLKEGRLFW